MRTYRDYAWLRSSYEGWICNGYSVTLIEAMSPSAVLDTLNVTSTRPEVTGFADIELEMWDFEGDGAADGFRNQVVAVADAGNGWSVLIQQNSGSIGVTDTAMEPLTAAHQVVTHRSDVEAVSQFAWWRDGVRQVSFEPMFAGAELGDDLSDAGTSAAVETIRSLIDEVGGIALDDNDGRPRGEHWHVEGAFALAERLSGVAITHEFLTTADFTVAVAPTDPTADDGGSARTAADSTPLPAHDAPTAPTWDEALRLHAASRTLTIHGVMTETKSNQRSTTLEFWFKPKHCWRFADERGLVFISNRRGDIWYRRGGTLVPRSDDESFSLSLHPDRLIDAAQNWDGTWGQAVTPDGTGSPVMVSGRPAWEYTLPSWATQRSRIAFDADTGIAVRWAETNIYELASFETGVVFDKTFFDGP